jgi:hypothetical protein
VVDAIVPGAVRDDARMRILSRAELNRALLARQLLLDRASLPLPRALERIGGIQAQYAPSMYVGMWSRLARLERDALTDALARKSIVQATLMRSTIHLVSRRDFWPLAQATREARRASWLRSVPEPGAESMADAAHTLRAHLNGGTIKRTDMDALLGKDRARAVGLWIDLVRVPPSGTWERRRADLYAAAEDWLGPAESGEAEGIELLVRRYLGGFGPAAAKDVASFTGLAPPALAPVLDRVATRRFRSEDGDELFDLPRAPLPDPETPAPVRFLPTWDATLLVHARRTGVLPEEHRSKIFSSRNPHSSPTFLVDGAVAGTWRYDEGGIRLDPFARLDAAATRALREEADRLAAFHA